ncbi:MULTISPECIES: hypothetical protein [Acinetobacter]|uniref:hypothetical protein n=1 Tax=Acinetobacter TaxID=469 RepID=UPI00257E3EF7|nr:MULTISPECIES: hypothetical protein [Acinetobacter]
MGIKYCKSCKKPMRPADTHCKTCGAHYKNNPLILVVIIVIMGGLGYFLWDTFAIRNVDNNKETVQTIINPDKNDKPKETKWQLEREIDKMTDKEGLYLSNKAINAETGLQTDAGLTIGCSYYGGLSAVFVADTPIKIRDFTKDGATGNYEIRFDNQPMSDGTSNLSSLNKVIVLSENHRAQIENSSRILIRITTATDNYKTYEIDSSNGGEQFSKIKDFCLTQSKQDKTI